MVMPKYQTNIYLKKKITISEKGIALLQNLKDLWNNSPGNCKGSHRTYITAADTLT